MTDEEVEAAYNEAAAKTGVGTNFWQDELMRRYQDRQAKALIRLTVWLVVFTIVVVILTGLLVWREFYG